MNGNSWRPSGTWLMPRAGMVWAGRAVMSWPSKATEPAVGQTEPEMTRRVVVLPAPLAPIRVTISPARTSGPVRRQGPERLPGAVTQIHGPAVARIVRRMPRAGRRGRRHPVRRRAVIAALGAAVV